MPKIKKRTDVKNLSNSTKDLTPDQAKRVKGGTTSAVLGDGSVRTADGSVKLADGTLNTVEKHLLKQ